MRPPSLELGLNPKVILLESELMYLGVAGLDGT